MHAEIGGKTVSRKYTPISLVNQKGSATFIIKIYREHPDFPGGGAFTQHLENNVQVGDFIMCEGPIGKLKYFGHGKFAVLKKELKPKTKLGLLAGGTGITPLLAVALASNYAQDGLDVKLLFSNKTKDDVLCKTEIDALAAKFPDTFKAFHTLTRHNDNDHGEWDGLRGRVTPEMLKQCGFADPADDVFVFVCGPSAFGKHCNSVMEEMGYQAGENFMAK